MKLSAYAKELGISYKTAFRHWKKGLIKGRQLETGTIIVESVVKNSVPKPFDQVILYARVSSSENKDNLQAQLVRLRQYATARKYTIVKEVSEIGSGINDNRKKLLGVLKLKEDWDIILVEHKDRFSRFGTGLIEELLRQQGKRIEVINETQTRKEEILQDLISIITSYSAKIYGLRRSKRKTEEIIRELEIRNGENNKVSNNINSENKQGETKNIE